MPQRPRQKARPFKGLSRLFAPRHPTPEEARLSVANKRHEEEIDVLARRIILPSQIVTDEELVRAMHQDRGQKLARKDLWDELAEKIQFADATRLPTPGGETASLLMAFGARSDLVAAAEDALYDGFAPDPEGLAALEEVLDDYPGIYPAALVVALAHIDIAWSWRNIAGQSDPMRAAEQASEHIERAADILAPFDGTELNAPSLVAARCALFAASDKRGSRVCEEYEKLIALDPGTPRHMRALGRHILPDYAGGLQALEVGARRVAAMTQDSWGAGAYTWVYFDALALKRGSLELLDVEFFIEGLCDIASRKQDQHVINLLTAFCAITMAPQAQEDMLTRQARENRAEIHACLDWLLKDHLRELHPLIWSQTLLSPGHGMKLPSRRALVAKGRQTALRIIAAQLSSMLKDGGSITFSPRGIEQMPAS